MALVRSETSSSPTRQPVAVRRATGSAPSGQPGRSSGGVAAPWGPASLLRSAYTAASAGTPGADSGRRGTAGLPVSPTPPARAARRSLTLAADGFVRAAPSGNTTVGTVWFPPFTDIT